jgi:hypothetical protein
MSARGFVLLPVLCFIVVIALLAYGASRSGPAAVAQLASSDDAASARYAAEAGLAHATWAAARSNCGTYTDLSKQGFGAARYDVSYGANSGSPVTLLARGSLPSGASYSAARTIDVYQLPVTLENQPDGGNADTFIQSKGSTSGAGTAKKLEIWNKSASDEGRALLGVDLSTLPSGARVVSATLELNAETSNVTAGAVLSAHALTRAWSEANATWNQYDVLLLLAQPWSTAGGDFDVAPAATATIDNNLGVKSLDLTTLVQDWAAGARPNYGVLLKGNRQVADLRIYSSDEANALRRPKLVVQYVCLCGSTCAPVIKQGTTLVLSTRDDGTLAGTSFKDGDLVIYDPASASARTLLQESDVFNADADIDALHLYEDGRIVLSTAAAANIAGLAFEDEDLVEYDPDTKVATLVFDGSAHFAANEDIDAAYVYDDGRIVLSTETAASLAGLAFDDDDLVEYNPTANTATLLFDGAAHFGADENIDAIQVLDDGRFILSTASDATLGGLSFTDADVVLYDALEDKAARIYDGSTLTSAPDSDVDAVHDFRPHPLTDEVRLEPIADTYLSSANPTTPLGGMANLNFGNSVRAMLRFDLAALPAGATVTSAVLYLNLNNGGTGLVTGAYKVTADWAEGTATWDNTGGGGTFDALPVTTATYSGAVAKWVSWSLPPALIQEWRDGVSPNYGLLLKPTLVALTTTSARSRNHTSSAAAPRLVVKYTLP